MDNWNKELLIYKLIICGVLCIVAYGCIISSECESFIADANVHLKLEQGGGRGYKGTRLYLSRTDTFGSDYIQFNSTPVSAPIIYLMEPDTLYVVDCDSFHVTGAKSRQFEIKYINHIYPADLKFGDDSATYNAYMRTIKNIERIDSCLDSDANYCIQFGEDGLNFTVFNSERKAIINCSAIHWLF